MTFQNIKFDKKDQIATITINRPEKLNALNMAVMGELRETFTAIKDDPEVRVALLTGEQISAQQALRIGLVNEVVPLAQLLSRGEEIAKKIIANAPLAVQYTLEAVNKGMEMPLAEGLFLEATLFSVACATEDKKEGTSAFLEKRAAAFKGK